MANTLQPVVPSEAVVLETTTVIPTLGRPSLQAAIESLKGQTEVVVKNDDRDTLIKIKEAVNESKTEMFVVADDDAVYSKDWIEQLSRAYGPGVGFVGGPCLPLIDENSSGAEKAIAIVTASYFGTSNMSYRAKAKGKVRKADETNLIGNGLYRRETFAKILNEEYDRIPPAAWETYVFTRLRQMGYKTMFNPQAPFKHTQRSNVFSFGKQIFRSGMGRINFFKQFPSQTIWKFWMFLPMLFLIYLIAFFSFAFMNFPIVPNWILIAYVAVLLLVSYYPKKNPRSIPLYYLAMHLSYGAGMLYGLIRNDRTWT